MSRLTTSTPNPSSPRKILPTPATRRAAHSWPPPTDGTAAGMAIPVRSNATFNRSFNFNVPPSAVIGGIRKAESDNGVSPVNWTDSPSSLIFAVNSTGLVTLRSVNRPRI